MGKSSRIVDAVSIIDYESKKFYSKHTKLKEPLTYVQYKSVIKAIYQKVGEHLLENTSGVYMDMLGYFSIVMNPIKKMAPGIKKLYPNTVNKIYAPLLFTNVTRGYSLSGWSMDKAFNVRKVKRKLTQRLAGGKHYKFEYTLLRSFGKSK